MRDGADGIHLQPRPTWEVDLKIGMLLVATAVLLSGCGDSEPNRTQGQATFVVRDVRVFDGERIAEHRSVFVEDGLIRRVDGLELAVPPGTEVIDGQGRTLLPGLIDAHVHLSDSTEADLEQALSLGVTTVFDMFSASTR